MFLSPKLFTTPYVPLFLRRAEVFSPVFSCVALHRHSSHRQFSPACMLITGHSLFSNSARNSGWDLSLRPSLSAGVWAFPGESWGRGPHICFLTGARKPGNELYFVLDVLKVSLLSSPYSCFSFHSEALPVLLGVRCPPALIAGTTDSRAHHTQSHPRTRCEHVRRQDALLLI